MHSATQHLAAAVPQLPDSVKPNHQTA